MIQKKKWKYGALVLIAGIVVAFTAQLAVKDTPKPSSQHLTSQDHKEIIKAYLKAEEAKDFDKVYAFLSPNMTRYYDMNQPNHTNLIKRFKHLWSMASNCRNYIKSIKQLNDSTYNLSTNYKYYNELEKRNMSKFHTIRFLFDSNGKITETYEI